jgi:hypothetical protein
MIWDMAHAADWQHMKQRKQTLINKKQNQKRIVYDSSIGHSILEIKAEQPREGPFNIIRVHANGAVTMQKGPCQRKIEHATSDTPCRTN